MDRGRDPACIPAPPNTENRAPKSNRPPARGTALGPGPARATSRKWRQRQARACPGARTRMSAVGVRMRPAGWIRAPQRAPTRAQSRRGPEFPRPGLVLRLPPHRRLRAAPPTRPSPPLPFAGCAPGGCSAPRSRDRSRTCASHVGAPQHGLRPARLVT